MIKGFLFHPKSDYLKGFFESRRFGHGEKRLDKKDILISKFMTSETG